MIKIENLGKRFYLYNRPLDRAMDWIGFAAKKQEFWALRQISMEIPEGSAVGIIGSNGAGKSTLLKILAGTLNPTEGTAQVEGRVAALLELGTGFHPEFTGRQNIWVNGQLLGLTEDDIRGLEQEIIDFSELGDFIDQPLRTYSSGMKVRLGFSVAAAVKPDVLIIDEALSVGDARFSQKCMKRIAKFRETGTTLLFVSHDPNAVTTLCDECFLLVKGEIKEQGAPKDVLDAYGALLAAEGTGNSSMMVQRSFQEEKKNGTSGLHSTARKSGTFHALITRVSLVNEKNQNSEVFLIGTQMRIQIQVMALVPLSNPSVGIQIQDHLGTVVFGTNTSLMKMDLGDWEAGEQRLITVSAPVQMGEGDYSLTSAIHQDETHLEECYDWTDRAAVFSVRPRGARKSLGRIILPTEWEISPVSESEGDSLDAVFSDLADPVPLKPSLPDPFLSGIYPVECAFGNDYRWCTSHAVFLVRPKNQRLLIQGFLPPEINHQIIKIRTGRSEEYVRFDVSEKDFVLELQIPVEETGRVIRVTADSDFLWNEPDKDRQLAFAISIIRSES